MSDILRTTEAVGAALGVALERGSVQRFSECGTGLLAEWGVSRVGASRDAVKLALAVEDPSNWIDAFAPSLSAVARAMPRGQPGVGLGATTGRFRYYHAAPVAEGGALHAVASRAIPELRNPLAELAEVCGAWRTAAIGVEVEDDRILRAAAYTTVPDAKTLAGLIERAAEEAGLHTDEPALSAFRDLCQERAHDWPLVWAARSSRGAGTKLYFHLRRRLNRPSDAELSQRLSVEEPLWRCREVLGAGDDVVQIVAVRITAGERPCWTLYLARR